MSAIEAQILETAGRLFFTQGYGQTGINQLIDESGVAKRTFYRHFSSKEALGVAYLDRGAEQWLAGLEQAAGTCAAPRDRLAALFRFLENFAQQTTFRGCGMLNMAAEFADAGSEIRARVRTHKAKQRQLIRTLLAPEVDAHAADAVHVLVEGAIAAAAAHLDVWPIRSALRAAQELIGKAPSRAQSQDLLKKTMRSSHE